MSTLAEIEQAIEKLPREDLFQLTGWLSTHFSDAWDRQIEEDIVAGRLDYLAARPSQNIGPGNRCLPRARRCRWRHGDLVLDRSA